MIPLDSRSQSSTEAVPALYAFFYGGSLGPLPFPISQVLYFSFLISKMRHLPFLISKIRHLLFLISNTAHSAFCHAMCHMIQMPTCMCLVHGSGKLLQGLERVSSASLQSQVSSLRYDQAPDSSSPSYDQPPDSGSSSLRYDRTPDSSSPRCDQAPDSSSPSYDQAPDLSSPN